MCVFLLLYRSAPPEKVVRVTLAVNLTLHQTASHCLSIHSELYIIVWNKMYKSEFQTAHLPSLNPEVSST